MDTAMTKHAAIYCRISSDPTGSRSGVDRQEADCRKRCEERGWEVLDLYVDNDRSAYSKTKVRPEFERLKRDVRAGIVDVIVVWATDRLYRQMRELEDIIDLLEESSTELEAIQVGRVEMATSSGRTIARMLGVVAQMESDDKSRRLRRKHEELAELGKVPGGGRRPFGFENDRKTHRPSEVALIQEAADRVLGGETLYAIQQDWIGRGVETSTGAPWSTTALKTFLINGRIAGLRMHERVGETQAEWDPIVDRETWERLRSLLTDPSRRRNPVVRKYLLTRIMTCGKCGHPLVATPRAEKRRGYGCVKQNGGCGSVYALADPIEQTVTTRVQILADSAGARRHVMTERTRRDSALGAVMDEMHAAESSLDEITRAHFVDKVVSRPQFLSISRELEERIAKLGERVAGMQGANTLEQHAGNVTEAWPTLTLEQQRSVIQGVLQSIVLLPAQPGKVRNKWDPDRLQIVPRWDVASAAGRRYADGLVELSADQEALLDEELEADRELARREMNAAADLVTGHEEYLAANAEAS